VGVDVLPLSEPDPATATQAGLFFAEGRDRVDTWLRGRGRDRDYRQVISLVSESPERMKEIPGDFGFALLRADGATIVRSVAGLVPWYVHHSSELLAVSTHMVGFHRVLPGMAIDHLVAAASIDGGTCPDRRTMLAGVSSLPTGHVASIDRDGRQRLVEYWGPPPTPRQYPGRAKFRDHAQELRRLLIEALSRDLDPEGGNLLALSGGVDSSSLGALAVGAAERRVTTLSVLPEIGSSALAAEAPYVDTMLELLRPERSWSLNLCSTSWVEVLDRAPRLGYPVAHPILAFLPTVLAEEEIHVYVGGEFADRLLVGPTALIDDWLSALSPALLLRAMVKPGRVPLRRRVIAERWVTNHLRQGVKRPRLPYRSELSSFIEPEIQVEYKEWLEREQRAMAEIPAPYRTLEMDRRLDGWIAQNWEVCSALGVRRSLPFSQRGLYELAYTCHPLEHATPPKRLLRAALDGDVPRSHLYREDKGSAQAWVDVVWGRALPDRLAGIVMKAWLDDPPAEASFDDAASLACLTVATEPPPDGRSQ
jgi:asparagine synthetase B (glutamine-hydrolysing)